ncbi:hypothetical protein BGP78_03315 [Pseudoalteromonas sp. MSK9-3]|uniref:DUF3293 domain-containing protein n=1 Tax=Pseudoalteromonas sp. MSK9-3 TaxID=1897633 RepID=UPI000E6C0C55|nr:DUF3293 domain-containing protein [Pseudoalteromonas sp. MSK9-3]RJE73303.1 hypothetical protein BGP78_03315 [Pseudoalteromonas sp. MSK9-3]
MQIDTNLWQLYCDVYFSSHSENTNILGLTDGVKGAIISVWNPFGKTLTLQQNVLFSRKVLTYLNSKAIPYFLLWGGSKDMAYRELSVFVRVDRARACQLAQQFKQLAYYYVDNGILMLINSHNRQQRTAVGGLHRRVLKVSGSHKWRDALTAGNLAIAKS